MADYPLRLIHEADREKDNPVPARSDRELPGTEVEFRIKRKDGSEVWVSACSQPIYDSKGTSLGTRVSLRDISRRKKVEEELVKAHKDLEIRVKERTEERIKVNENLLEEITERKRVEEELRKSEEQFRLFVQNAKEYAIVFYNAEGCIASWNDGAERITGYRAKEIMGKHISVFYSREDNERKKPWRILEITGVQGQFKEEGWRIRQRRIAVLG